MLEDAIMHKPPKFRRKRKSESIENIENSHIDIELFRAHQDDQIYKI